MRLTIAIALLCAVATALCAEDLIVKVYVNGKLQKYDPPARVREGKTYVPLRQGAASLGFTCEWLEEHNAAKVCSHSGCLLIPKKDGIIVNDRMFLPLRRMAEAFNAKVKWDPKKKAVIIQKPKSRSPFQ